MPNGKPNLKTKLSFRDNESNPEIELVEYQYANQKFLQLNKFIQVEIIFRSAHDEEIDACTRYTIKPTVPVGSTRRNGPTFDQIRTLLDSIVQQHEEHDGDPPEPFRYRIELITRELNGDPRFDQEKQDADPPKTDIEFGPFQIEDLNELQ